MSRPPSLRVPGERVSPHVSMGRATCPLLWAAAPGAAGPCGVSLGIGDIAQASLPYDCLTPVAGVPTPVCLTGDPLLDFVPAHLSPVASRAPGDVCHGPRCSLPGFGPAALGNRPCYWLGGSAGSPRCARPMGCGLLLPVPRSHSARTCVLCPGPLGSCSPMWPFGVLLYACGVPGHFAPVQRSARPLRCPAYAASWATWLLFTRVPVLVCCFAPAVSWDTWLLFSGMPAWCAALCVRCPRPLGSG